MLQDGTFECITAALCDARTRPLKRLGVAEVLRVVEANSWNFTRSAKALGVDDVSVRWYLNRHAPKDMAEARSKGLITRHWKPVQYKIYDAGLLRRTLDRYYGRRDLCAKALGVTEITLYRAMARLIPGEFPLRVEQRRQWARRAA